MTVINFRTPAATGSSTQAANAVPLLSHHSVVRYAASLVATLRSVLSFAGSVVTWPIDFLRDFYGVEPLDGRVFVASIVDRHRVERCRLRCGDIHDLGEICRYQRVGDCSSCGQSVSLDYFGNCSLSGERYRLHPISNRRSHPHAGMTITKEGRMRKT